MRQILVLCAGLAAACSTTPQPASQPPAEAKIVGRYSLTSPGASIGTITSIVRCGSTLYASDTETRIHRIDSVTGQIQPPLEDASMMPMALASDCERNRIWAVSPNRRDQGLRAIGFDLSAGNRTRELEVATPCFPTSAIVSGDVLFIGGECIDGAIEGHYAKPDATTYFADKRIGVRVLLSSGESQRGLVPFETSCYGAGACVGGSIDVSGGNWLATLPVASRIGIYAADGKLLRTLPVSSPAFVTDGVRLSSGTSSEARVRWSTRNSAIHKAFAIGDHIAVVHYLLDVPPGWTMGGAKRPQFRTRLNVLTGAGEPLHLDLPLPELPVGSDTEALYLVDYGPQGRRGAHESVTVLRVAVPAP